MSPTSNTALRARSVEQVKECGVHVGHTAIGGRIAPGADHEPDDIAEVLWRHHTDRRVFQTRLGID